LVKGGLSEGRPRGRMRLRVQDAGGRPVAERSAGNMVLRGGAALIARLFAGAAGGAPINAIGIGFAQNPGSAELMALLPPPADLGIPAEALRTPLPAESFAIATDRAGSVRVDVAATFKPIREIAGVTEAGLLAGDILYNQVIFEPVTLTVGQDVTFFWEIDFPFGH
jgi:hypothetical protein